MYNRLTHLRHVGHEYIDGGVGSGFTQPNGRVRGEDGILGFLTVIAEAISVVAAVTPDLVLRIQVRPLRGRIFTAW